MCRAFGNAACVLLALFVLTAAAVTGGAAETGGTEPRTRLWSSKVGTYLRAKFVRVDGENVVSLKEEGGEVSVPTAQLSKVDQEYVATQKTDATDAPPPPASAKVAGKGESTELEQKCQELCEQLTRAYKGANPAKKQTIAVVEFSDLSGGVTDVGRLISEELITKLFSTGNYKVIERLLLNKAIAEHKLQLQGIVDPQSAKELGKILGVDSIVTGTIADRGDAFRVNARLISTETGEVFSVAAVTIRKDDSTVVVGGGGTSSRPNATGRSTGPRGKAQLPFYEDFSKYQDGQETEWARGPVVRTGEDGRKWLVSSQNGQKTISIPMDLPDTAYIEFDYDAQSLQSNRDMGTILSSMSLIDEAEAKYKIEWSIQSERFPLIPYSSAAGPRFRDPREQYHALRLPGGTSQQVSCANGQPIHVSVQGNRVSVSLGECQVSATVLDFKKFTRFEVDLYKGPNAVLALTNFKVGKLPPAAGPTR